MNALTVLTMSASALAVSAACWLLLGIPLRRALEFLCNDSREGIKEISGLFWQRLYLGLTLFLPLLFVLLFVPESAENQGEVLLYSLRWSMIGGVGLLLLIAYLVRRQVQDLKSSIPDTTRTPRRTAYRLPANSNPPRP